MHFVATGVIVVWLARLVMTTRIYYSGYQYCHGWIICPVSPKIITYDGGSHVMPISLMNIYIYIWIWLFIHGCVKRWVPLDPICYLYKPSQEAGPSATRFVSAKQWPRRYILGKTGASHPTESNIPKYHVLEGCIER